MTSRSQPAFVLRGGNPLRGSVSIGGSKNATLGAMAAALLVEGQSRLDNVPRIHDVDQMAEVLRSLGATVGWDGPNSLQIDASRLTGTAPERTVAESIRGSFLIMGALLSRMGRAACPPPGGDVIGLRPVDVHLRGFAALGATIVESKEWFEVDGANLSSAQIFNDYPSVLGTQNLMMAAARIEGATTIVNAAAEPEVHGLADMLRQMGVDIEGDGTNTIVVRGAKQLRGTEYSMIPDRLEAGTFAIATAITGGEVELRGAVPGHITSLIHKLRQAGVSVETDGDWLRVRRDGDLRAVTIQALPYPGFATDLQAPMAVLLTQADGLSRVMERVFDNRLLYVEQLNQMGAKIETLDNTTAIISGPTPLTGGRVRALDVRAGAAFILAGLAADGQTEVTDIYHIDRGYERIDEKLKSVGAEIQRV